MEDQSLANEVGFIGYQPPHDKTRNIAHAPYSRIVNSRLPIVLPEPCPMCFLANLLLASSTSALAISTGYHASFKSSQG